jgi:glycerol kinase
MVGAAEDARRDAAVQPRDLRAVTNQLETTLVWERRTGRPIAPGLSGKTGELPTVTASRPPN